MEFGLTSPASELFNSTTSVDVFRGLVTDRAYYISLLCYCVYVVAMSTLGIVTNAINIKTFISMGLEDGVTVSFLVLSISDLAYLVAVLVRGIASGFFVTEAMSDYKIRFPVQPYAIFTFFGNVGILLYVNTVLITTFLAVARCICVAKPLHFKNAFTKKRSIWILIIFAVFSVFSYVPILYYMGLFSKYDPDTDSVRPSLYVSQKRELVKDIVWGIRDTCLAFVTQFVVIICVVVMAKSLQQASKFRQSSMTANVDNIGKKDSSERNKKDNSEPSKLSGKDLQVVQQVILISFVYILCNMPKIMVTAAGFVEAGLTLGKRYNNIYVLAVCVLEACQMINSSINLFIYYQYNSKFRSCCNICTHKIGNEK